MTRVTALDALAIAQRRSDECLRARGVRIAELVEATQLVDETFDAYVVRLQTLSRELDELRGAQAALDAMVVEFQQLAVAEANR